MRTVRIYGETGGKLPVWFRAAVGVSGRPFIYGAGTDRPFLRRKPPSAFRQCSETNRRLFMPRSGP